MLFDQFSVKTLLDTTKSEKINYEAKTTKKDVYIMFSKDMNIFHKMARVSYNTIVGPTLNVLYIYIISLHLRGA